MEARGGARPCKEQSEGNVLVGAFGGHFFHRLCFFFFFFPPVCSSQKLRPKRNQPWRLALQRKLAAAANQAEASELAEKLRGTTLE